MLGLLDDSLETIPTVRTWLGASGKPVRSLDPDLALLQRNDPKFRDLLDSLPNLDNLNPLRIHRSYELCPCLVEQSKISKQMPTTEEIQAQSCKIPWSDFITIIKVRTRPMKDIIHKRSHSVLPEFIIFEADWIDGDGLPLYNPKADIDIRGLIDNEGLDVTVLD